MKQVTCWLAMTVGGRNYHVQQVVEAPESQIPIAIVKVRQPINQR